MRRTTLFIIRSFRQLTISILFYSFQGEFIIQAKVTNQRGDVLLCLKGTVYTKSSDDYSYPYDDYSYYF